MLNGGDNKSPSPTKTLVAQEIGKLVNMSITANHNHDHLNSSIELSASTVKLNVTPEKILRNSGAIPFSMLGPSVRVLLSALV